jgi:hypothetical protein
MSEVFLILINDSRIDLNDTVSDVFLEFDVIVETNDLVYENIFLQVRV